jgi:signal transduction histidine kinase
VKIRAQFAGLVVGITLIPVLLLAVGAVLMNLTQDASSIPLYNQLPRESEGLTDEASWTKIRNILARQPLRGHTLVFDDSFRLIFSKAPEPDIPPGRSVDPAWLLDHFRQIPKTSVFLIRIGELKAWVLATIGDEELHDPLQGPLIVAGVVLLIILLISIAASILLARSLTRSIVVLEKAVRRVAEGDLDTKVDARLGSDEIRALGRSVDQLRVSLQEENSRKSRFVMGLSHDLKTPLALIKGYAELLRDGPVPTEKARVAHLDLVLDKVDQLDGMIEDLIDYSKANTGEWQQSWSEVPLKAFLEDYAPEAVLDGRLLGRSFEVEIDLPADLKLSCDPKSLERCLQNLTSNAMRYTREGDRVGLRAQRRENAVEISVWDTGPGIAPEDLPHLFELFYRGSASRREPGMGIGLAVVKTLIESHGWAIRAESKSGARFIITIPWPAAASSSSPDPSGRA